MNLQVQAMWSLDGLTTMPGGVWVGAGLATGLALGFAWRRARRSIERLPDTGLPRRLLEREEIERKRVAQAVHDGLGHQLLALKTAAAQARDRPSADDALRAQLGQIEVLASDCLDTARGIAYRLRPFELDQLDLKAAIKALLTELCKGTDLRVFKDLEALPGDFTPAQQTQLFRFVQEGVLNVVRHAHAANLLLEIKRTRDGVTIQLEDDGAGFDRPAGRQGPNGGLGLARMEIHAQTLGGELELTSSPGRGTRVRLFVPTPSCPAK